jgi:hypothetical protein
MEIKIMSALAALTMIVGVGLLLLTKWEPSTVTNPSEESTKVVRPQTYDEWVRRTLCLENTDTLVRDIFIRMIAPAAKEKFENLKKEEKDLQKNYFEVMRWEYNYIGLFLNILLDWWAQPDGKFFGLLTGLDQDQRNYLGLLISNEITGIGGKAVCLGSTQQQPDEVFKCLKEYGLFNEFNPAAFDEEEKAEKHREHSLRKHFFALKKESADMVQKANFSFFGSDDENEKLLESSLTTLRAFGEELENYGKEVEKAVGITALKESLRRGDLGVIEEDKKEKLIAAATKFSRISESLEGVADEFFSTIIENEDEDEE